MADNNPTDKDDKIYPLITNRVMQVLEDLQMPNGMYETYAAFIRRMEFLLISKGEELDLDDSTALSYIRILYMLRRDLEGLANIGEDPEGEESDNL